jgi:hypothetical protein
MLMFGDGERVMMAEVADAGGIKGAISSDQQVHLTFRCAGAI